MRPFTRLRPGVTVPSLVVGLAILGCAPGGEPPHNATDGGVAACVAPGPAPRELPDGVAKRSETETDSRKRIVAPADTCDRAEFFIEMAEGAPTPCAEFAGQVEVALEEALSEKLCNYLGASDEERDREGAHATGNAAEFSPAEFCAAACDPEASGGAEGDAPDRPAWRPRAAATFNVSVVPVFRDDNATIALPDGADRRFFRIALEATSGRAPVTIVMPDASVCSYLEDIHAAVDAALATCRENGTLGPASPGECAPPTKSAVRIGRECRMLGAGLQATAEMRTWHLDRLGVTGAPEASPAGPDSPRLVLIDSGVESGLPVLARYLPDGSVDAVEPEHPHGSLLAAMMLQVFPTAQLVSYRAIGADEGAAPGVATTADLARSIWRAVGGQGRSDDVGTSLVINLSLGWPETLSRPRRVRGLRRTVDPESGRWRTMGRADVCDIVEDGPGEAVRYALAMAHHAAEFHGGPVATFAAAGNRSHALRETARAAADALGHVNCAKLADDDPLKPVWCDGAGPRPEAPMFLPALWGVEGVRVNPWAPETCGLPARVVEPVSALDALDLPTAADPAVAPALLAAPGDHVYASHPGLSRGNIPVGGLCDSAALRRRQQPMPLSGTSVSTALTSAVAASVQARLVASGRDALGSEALTRFLYVTGLDLLAVDGGSGQRPSLEGPPARRPNLCRALAVLDAPCAEEVLACAGDLSAVGPGPGDLPELADCAATADACAASTRLCDAPAVGAPAVPAGYPPAPVMGAARADCPQSTFSGTTATIWKPTGTAAVAGGARAEKLLSLAAAGIVGPQPPIPICPDCLLTYARLTMTTGKVTLVVDVNTRLPTGTKIERPRLVIYDTRLTTSTGGSQTLDLTSTAFTMTPALAPSAWKAGTRVTITGPAPVGTGLLSANPDDWRKFMKAELVANVSGSSLITSPVDVSALRLSVP